ncbi:DUF5751 family protein [Acidianus brierleyi]|uniref:DUF5751 domain-containing protein n=1 Tax=Acidianus brierleyi TaxID=41673 RepID=A0A2U9IDU6_9CREN|nr:DUF5751 family protein [Acidianus brierleyi]AWR94218.1 hypothetical protein DFR85_06055 [Acidianus brierleyi]
METDFRPIIVLFSAKNEETTELFRKVLREAKVLGGKKLIIHVIEDVNYWDFFSNSREAILDNLDLGIEIYTWKTTDTENMIKKIEEINNPKGIVTFCSDDYKYMMRKIIDNLPTSLKANIIKDYCK